MGLGEDTLIDAPVTPAPIFAYRALKAVFWGNETENTPEQSLTKIVSLADRPSEAEKRSRSSMSPVHLTPGQKRKHSSLALPSPTKSILRTPGAHTPRRALLKDLNVKFKDARKSVSPEMARAELGAAVKDILPNGLDEKENRPMGGLTNNKTKIEYQDKIATASKPTTSKLVLGKPRPEDPKMTVNETNLHTATTTMTTINTGAFDAEAYMRNTEKEMKKLIRYSQKMREYARRQDEENDKLRQLLDETRRENERLQRDLDASRRDSNIRRSNKDRFSEQVVSDTHRKTVSSTIPNTKQLVAKEANPAFEFEIDMDITTNPTNPKPKPNLKPSASHSKSSDREEFPSPAKKQRHLPQTHPQGPKGGQQDDQPSLRPLLTTTTTRLGPDRLAAARARVRQKAEMRKASSETAGRVETSLVDWAGL